VTRLSIKFVAVREDENGKITLLKTDTGQIVSFHEAQQLVREGKVDSLTELKEDGTWVIDDELQHAHGVNFDILPHF
jgi:hypothetical protein